jgi:hypothetical protein
MPIKKKKIVEKVVAFEGEQDFIVNPNKPEYISAGEVLYVEALGSGQTATGTSGTGVQGDTNTGGSPQSVSYLIPDWNGMDCPTLMTAITSLSAFISTGTANLPPAEVTYYNDELSKAKTLYRTKCTNIGTPTPQPSDQATYPKFTVPDWNTLTCDQIKLKVSELDKFIKDYDSKFITVDRLYYETALTNGKDQQNVKCAVAPTTPPASTTTVTTSTQIIPPPRFFGGGGGGFGGSLEEKTTVVDKKKGGINWLLLILIAGGIYLFAKKKK